MIMINDSLIKYSGIGDFSKAYHNIRNKQYQLALQDGLFGTAKVVAWVLLAKLIVKVYQNLMEGTTALKRYRELMEDPSCNEEYQKSFLLANGEALIKKCSICKGGAGRASSRQDCSVRNMTDCEEVLINLKQALKNSSFCRMQKTGFIPTGGDKSIAEEYGLFLDLRMKHGTLLNIRNLNAMDFCGTYNKP